VNHFFAFCQIAFAFFAPSDTPPRELILETYQRLWNEIGHIDRNPELATAMIEKRDPFAKNLVGKEEERDAAAMLERHLGKFETMLTDRGWNTPDVKASLIDFLEQRLRAQRAQADAMAPILKREGIVPKTYQLTHTYRFLTPDGKYFLSADDLYTKDVLFTFHDRNSGQTTDDVQPHIDNHKLYVRGFTPDGKHLVLADGRGPAMRLVPYAEGKLDLKHPKIVSAAPLRYRLAPALDKRDSKPAEIVSFGKDGLIGMHCGIGGTFFFVFDTKSGKGWEIENHGYKWPENSVSTWGFIPNTRRLFFVINEVRPNAQGDASLVGGAKSIRIDVRDLDGKGLGPARVVGLGPYTGVSIKKTDVAVSGDGRYLAVAAAPGLQLVDLQSEQPVAVDISQKFPDQYVSTVFPDPKGKGFGAVVNESGGPSLRTLYWFDPEKQTWSEDQRLHMRLHDDYMLSPDGMEIITNVGDKAYRSQPFHR